LAADEVAVSAGKEDGYAAQIASPMNVRAEKSSGNGISSRVGVNQAIPEMSKYASREPRVLRVNMRWRYFQVVNSEVDPVGWTETGVT
jgi:hypothetical protein